MTSVCAGTRARQVVRVKTSDRLDAEQREAEASLLSTEARLALVKTTAVEMERLELARTVRRPVL